MAVARTVTVARYWEIGQDSLDRIGQQQRLKAADAVVVTGINFVN